MQNVNHPNVLKLLDYEVERNPNGQTTRIRMPFYKKGTLSSLLEENRANPIHHVYMKESQILKMFLSACNAVKEFHKRNPPLSHNDIKPGNLLVSDSGELVLFDFGSVSNARHTIKSRKEALELQEWSESNMTALYKAPELFDVSSDCTVDERTDIWALGCTLFAMCFNVSPFETEATGGSIALAVTSGKIDYTEWIKKRETGISKTHKKKEVSKEMISLMMSLLNMDPRKRPHIEEVIQDVSSQLKKSDRDVRIQIN